MSQRATYVKAMKTAERELIALIRQQEDIERKIAQTRQTVLTLRMKVHPNTRGYGHVSKTLTDAARTALFASRKPLDPIEIFDAVRAMGFVIKAKNQLASVHSVIRRLVQQGHVVHAYMLGADGRGPILWRHHFWPNVEGIPLPKGWVLLDDDEFAKEQTRQQSDGATLAGLKSKEE